MSNVITYTYGSIFLAKITESDKNIKFLMEEEERLNKVCDELQDDLAKSESEVQQLKKNIEDKDAMIRNLQGGLDYLNFESQI